MASNTLFQQNETMEKKKRPAWMESGSHMMAEGCAPTPHMADGRKPMPVYRVRSTKVTAQPMLADGKEKWAAEAFKPSHRGMLHRALHVPEGEKIPAGKMNSALHSGSSHVRHMAQAAKNI